MVSSKTKFLSLSIRCQYPEDVKILGKDGKRKTSYTRYLYLKPHAVRNGMSEEDKNSSKEVLFAANVSPFWSVDDLERLFSTFAPVKQVSVGNEKVRKSRFATVTFKKPSGVARTLKRVKKYVADESDFHVSESNDVANSSSVLSCLTPERLNVVVARQEIDEYMHALKEEQKLELERQQLMENQVDEDGFEKVSYKKSAKRRVLLMSSSELETIAKTKARVKKKDKSKEFGNFYRFQMREAKRSRLETLKEKFEQDKLQIKRLKAARKFKPF
mmetsp:Transcript_17092/g.19449  ORF Transcript_17092/g.19449 Transcript_17092/m.19449 type:complete len:273 (+) Transcript_17092:123-941(+)